MAPNAKRVFYVEYLSSPLYAQVIGQRPDVQLDRVENKLDYAAAAPILSAAHVYQAGASRQVLAKHYHVTSAMIRWMWMPAPRAASLW
jgi:D-3-phosphoglycerate dehydrogenase